MYKDGVSGPAMLKDEALDCGHVITLVSLRDEASLTGKLTLLRDILITYLYSQQTQESQACRNKQGMKNTMEVEI